MTQIQLYIEIPKDRPEALKRRDEIISALKSIGLDTVLINEQLSVYLRDTVA